jgi:hypothetical protein
MKKVLAFLLVVLFVTSLTAVTASAARRGGHHDGDIMVTMLGATMAAAGDGATTIRIVIGGMPKYYPNCDWVLSPRTNPVDMGLLTS